MPDCPMTNPLSCDDQRLQIQRPAAAWAWSAPWGRLWGRLRFGRQLHRRWLLLPLPLAPPTLIP